MAVIDFAVLIAYVIGLLIIGGIFSARISNSSDLFLAGRQSPWWVSGLSGFMTMFSAGTFVVWGGVAFRLGLVAVCILTSMGISAMCVGYFLAGRWRQLGVNTAAEYLEMRFGRSVVQAYTALYLTARIFGVAVAVYAIAVMMAALMPLPAGAWFRDAETGHLSVPWAVGLGGGLVVLYTVAGGLWAVLMTDVLQFIVLILAVVIVIPLSLARIGGLEAVLAQAPEGFLLPVGGEYGAIFLLAYGVINFLRIGAEWAFVQRYLCVPTEKDARKSAYLFGFLYLTNPIFWMLPPMLYRIQDPQANPEQAYILACQAVLPAGMVGMMVAAMFSATASMASGELNVYASVLTRDIYRRFLASGASEKHLVWVGRFFTALLGTVFILVALGVPHLGGAEKVVLAITGLFAGPMVLPPIWALFSRRIGRSAVWLSLGMGFSAAAVLKFGFSDGGWLAQRPGLAGWVIWVRSNMQTLEVVVGLLVPAAVLFIIEVRARGLAPGWLKVADHIRAQQAVVATPSTGSRMPSQTVAWSVATLAVFMAAIAILSARDRLILGTFSGLLFMVSVLITWFGRRSPAHRELKRVPRTERALMRSEAEEPPAM